jgi:hypothetical protein
MDYGTHARTIVEALQELRKKAPTWWHASQVEAAAEMLGSSICIHDLELSRRTPEEPIATTPPPPAPEAAASPRTPVETDEVPKAPEEGPVVVYDEERPAWE